MEPKKPTLGKDWIVHYAAAYSPLVEALKIAIEVADLHPQHAKYAARWRQLLEKLGEDVPPKEEE